MENNENHIKIKQLIWIENSKDAIGVTYKDLPDGKTEIEKAYVLKGLADQRDMINASRNSEDDSVEIITAVEEIQESNLDNPEVAGLVNDVLEYMEDNPTIPATIIEETEPIEDIHEEIQNPCSQNQMFDVDAVEVQSENIPDDVVKSEE